MPKAIIPVILCGGSGTRLWPASRGNRPKQFLHLVDENSLLQNTARRALHVSGAFADDLVTVTLGSLKDGVKRQLSALNIESEHILSEPSARNTAAAVALAASYVQKTFGDETFLWILPADHQISNEQALTEAFDQALKAAEQGYLVTFGIQPTRPETGYGYIRVGTEIEGITALYAQEFVEKPDAGTAQSYLNSGDYLWNSGMFLFETKILLDQYQRYAPGILESVHQALDQSDNANQPDEALYGAIPSQPFDKAIMEKSEFVAVVPCNPDWSDIGSWESLWEIREKDSSGNVADGRVAFADSSNCLVMGERRLIACVGVENLAIIDTGDALLIADRNNTDSMRNLIQMLKDQNTRELIDFPESDGTST